MIALRKIRELDLSAAPSPGRHAHLSAASGLVRVGGWFYVIADDELHLGVFSSTHSEPGNLIRLFPGELSGIKAERKAQKPDLEALMLLPPAPRSPHGALFALGSGSRRNRRRAALLPLDGDGGLEGGVSIVDLSPTFAALDTIFPALNIEGAVVWNGNLCVLQRGNKGGSPNAVIRFALSDVLGVLGAGHGSAPLQPLSIHRVDLGKIGAIPLSFTDGAALPNGDLVFTAVAEATDDNYHDGPCAGSAVGVLSADGTVRWISRLDDALKVEGIDATVEDHVLRLLLVTDADDENAAAALFEGSFDVANVAYRR